MAYVDPLVVNVGNGGDLDPSVSKTLTSADAQDSNALAPTAKVPETKADVEAYIRQAAIKRGMDPDTAVKVAKSEALNVFDPTAPDKGGDEGSSFGPLQLHYAGMSKSMPHAGLGDEFTAATGLDARDSSTWRQQVDFGLDHAKKNGWGAWMGAKNTGIGNWEGIKEGARSGAMDEKTSAGALSLPAGAASDMGGDVAQPSETNKFPAAPTDNIMDDPQTKKLLTLMIIKGALNNVQFQKVDYDPWAVIKA